MKPNPFRGREGTPPHLGRLLLGDIYVSMTMSCYQCHRYIKNMRIAKWKGSRSLVEP